MVYRNPKSRNFDHLNTNNEYYINAITTFPPSAKLVNPTLGFYEDEGMVYYLHNGSPIFYHKKEDIAAYRYICGNLVFNKLCTAVDLAKAHGVNRRNIQRYAAAMRRLARISIRAIDH